MRVTERMIQDSALRHLQTQMEGLTHVNEQIASGKRLGRPAEDPVAAGEVLELHSDLEGLDAYERTIEFSQGWVAVSDGKLHALADLVVKARTVALRGSSSTNESVLPELADEAEEVLKEAVSVANARHGGDYVFAGFMTGTKPFNSDGTPAAGVDLSGAIMREIESGHQVQVNASGDAIQPVLSELADLVDSLRTGDVTTVAGHIDLLDDELDRVTAETANIGLAARQLDAVQERMGSAHLDIKKRLSDVEDTDMAEAIVELKSREQGYQATLATIARQNRQSLIDYLR